MIFEREKNNRLSDAMECGVYIMSYIINSSSSNYLDDVNELKNWVLKLTETMTQLFPWSVWNMFKNKKDSGHKVESRDESIIK